MCKMRVIDDTGLIIMINYNNIILLDMKFGEKDDNNNNINKIR